MNYFKAARPFSRRFSLGKSVLLGCTLFAASTTYASLTGMNLEQLMDVSVTSVSRHEQPLNSAAAAIYTITQDDIQRSGATSLPEILRQAPGLEVARISASTWAITARGFNSQFANKLLVLIDGRSVYTPLFSGVYWDQQLPPLNAIQRIEIIRGPGASQWGSNAVNGVINVITFDSSQTLGQHLTLGGGDQEHGFVRAMHGFRSGTLTGRVNLQHRRAGENSLAGSEHDASDDYESSQLGTRIDWLADNGGKLTLDASLESSHKHLDIAVAEIFAPLVTPRRNQQAEGAHLRALWEQPLSNGDRLQLQAYSAYDDRNDALARAELVTHDLELQYNHRDTRYQRITWGLNQRSTRDHIHGSALISTENPSRSTRLRTAFLQDEIHLSSTVDATLGLKLEDSTQSDFEYQPSARVAWCYSDNATLWASVSRATRTPSRLERSLEFRGPMGREIIPLIAPFFPGKDYYVVVRGNKRYHSEILNAYELGWRWQWNHKGSLDLTAFQNQYRNLQTMVIAPLPDNPDLRYLDYGLVGLIVDNRNVARGHSNGIELVSKYFMSEDWKISGSYSWYNFVSSRNLYSTNAAHSFETQSPEHQARIASTHILSKLWELDWSVRYVDSIFNGAIPAHTDVDIRLMHRLSPTLNVSIIGKNLIDPQHPEFLDYNYAPDLIEIRRSAHLQIDWRNDS
ncbi:TonB-dependent receptor [gamma proteobacterium HdN1]|nr:TonB-dependent receptor [gamma proteobacterium HdN1]